MLLEAVHGSKVRVDEDQIPDNRNVFLDLASASVLSDHMAHWNKGLYACFIKLFLDIHVPAIRSTHRKPDPIFVTAHTYLALTFR